jgi:transposase
LKEKGYKILEWPPYFLNLNPIEHVCAELKRLVYKLHLELYTIEGPEDAILERIKAMVYEAWEQISNEFLYNLVDSMHVRVEAVKKARGGYTHY